MSAIDAKMVKALRDKTGAGIMECKAALGESEGDEQKAIEILRKKNLMKAQEKAVREASEGVIGSYIHHNKKLGVLAVVNCETDFVAKTDDFIGFASEIAQHCAVLKPQYLKREDVPENVIEMEKEVYRAQLKEEGKPEKIWDKIIEGKINKFFSEVCLMEQEFAFDEDITVEQRQQQVFEKVKENIKISKFEIFEI